MRFLVLAAACAAVAVSVVVSAAAAAPKTLWASPSGGGTACTANAPCALATAVSSAAPGSTVRARGGTYQGGVVVSTPLNLVTAGQVVLDATTSSNGVGIEIASGGSGSSVSGFTVENAKFEGILAVGVSNVTIDHNVLVNNDTGLPAQAEGECAPSGQIPGDCGEAIHLMSVTDSVVSHNNISGNAGGILLTDEIGETAHNVIENNVAVDNPYDCGITLASHTSSGVHDNVVQNNVSDGNGVLGEGGGILIAGGGPFTAAYDNVIRNNEASGNDLAGVVIHQHFQSDLSGNVIENNRLSNDNVGGDEDFLVHDEQTTGILVASGSPFPNAPFPPLGPLQGTVIRNNQISNVEVGIWTLGVDPGTTVVARNHFGPNVTTPISTN